MGGGGCGPSPPVYTPYRTRTVHILRLHVFNTRDRTEITFIHIVSIKIHRYNAFISIFFYNCLRLLSKFNSPILFVLIRHILSKLVKPISHFIYADDPFLAFFIIYPIFYPMLYNNSEFISIVVTFHPTYQKLITIHIIPPYFTTEHIDLWLNLLTIPK